jgi:alkyl sulfatase BDS1-like metallo-beta-lactamase superfamily hydrolase
VVAYLSPEWIAALRDAAAADAPLRDAAASRTVGFTQVVVGADGDDVVYHLSVHDGALDIGPGPAAAEDVRFTQNRATAVAVAKGHTNAQHAFISGEIELAGDLNVLREHQSLLLALDRAWENVRARTDYGE